MKVYLAGPINGCSNERATDWRNQAKALLGDACVDPMSRDYRGIESEIENLVVDDLADIDASTCVLANCWTPSYGTAMELWYASNATEERGPIPVVLVVPDPDVVSPWLRYVASAVVGTIEDAAGLILRWFG